MRLKTVAIFLFSFFAWGAFVFEAAGSGEVDNSGLSFLKLGLGAKGVGMGEALTAQTGEASSAWWNPAGLSGIQGIELSFTHTQWFQDVTAEHLASALSLGKNTLGLGLAIGKVPEIQKREGPTDQPIALFDAHDVVFSFSFARNLREEFALGLTAKWLYEKIDIHSASGFGFDLGGIYSALENLKLGLAVLNLGQKIKFEQEKFSQPTQYKVGVIYSAEHKGSNSDFTFGVDLVKPTDDQLKIHMGGEYGLYRALKIRLGYQSGYDEKDFSFGLGTRFREYSIDYGYLPHKSGLGDVHSLSFNIRI